MTDDIHDFYGPYQIHTTHDGHRIVFVKGVYEAFDMESPKLKSRVQSKITELQGELMKWQLLKDQINA